MLVLTRKPNESIAVGDGVRITVMSIEGDRVRIGIEAPSDLKILRGEVYEALRAAPGPSDNPDAS